MSSLLSNPQFLVGGERQQLPEWISLSSRTSIATQAEQRDNQLDRPRIAGSNCNSASSRVHQCPSLIAVVTPSRKRTTSGTLFGSRVKKPKPAKPPSPKTTFQAIRDALCHPECTPYETKELLWACGRQSEELFNSTDEFGCYLFDHVLKSIVHQMSDQSEQGHKRFVRNLPFTVNKTALNEPTMERLSLLVRKQAQVSSRKFGPQPLIQLVSMASTTPLPCLKHMMEGGFSRESWLLKCTKVIATIWPQSLIQTSAATGCTCVHLALRYAGNDLELIKYFLTLVPTLAKIRNQSGDLPLHLASKTQVPLSVLQLVIEATLRDESIESSNPVGILGLTNHAGYTALDLELVNYLEGERGRNISHSSITIHSENQQLPQILRTLDFGEEEPQGIQARHFGEEEPQGIQARHLTLWRRVVQHHLMSKTKMEYRQEEWHMNTVLFPRVFMIVNASASQTRKHLSSLPNHILHKACLLSQPQNPSIPWFLLELLIAKFPEQVGQPDETGKLPLHHAVTVFGCCVGQKCSLLWFKLIQQLLNLLPESIKARDDQGRLPLHCFLGSIGPFIADHGFEQHKNDIIYPFHVLEKTGNENSNPKSKILSVLVQAFPESLHAPDPVTGLLPCLQAAISCNLSDTFHLLRSSPTSVLSL